MSNRTNAHRLCLVAILCAATWFSAGCADTEIQGVILNEDLNTPELMLGLARGINSEFGDIYLASTIQWGLESPTDGLTNDGVAIGEIDATVSDFRQRPQSGLWAQAHEASWSVIFGQQRMQEVFTPERFTTSPELARIFVYGGHAERILGESFCELVYNYGIEGGELLAEPGPYDASRVVPNDSAFRRAIAMFEIALDHAEAGVAAGVAAPEADPIFDPSHLVLAAHAGLAQAYANLGEWSTALTHARMIPDDYEDWSLMDSEVDGGNDIADWFYQSDDLSIYRTPAAMLWPDDPRVALAKCGDWRNANMDDSPGVPPTSAFVNMSSACGNLSGEYRSESNRYPLWISHKYEDDSADIEIASGAEMRLIEAEAALLAGNLGEFTTQVNRARAARGVEPITQPAAAGALEYPNAEDDAWSILDRERYLENFLEARRFWDLRRWNHPFWTGNHVLLPRLESQLAPIGRMQCLPIPNQECTTNSAIACPSLEGD
jgi:hypothetical protein